MDLIRDIDFRGISKVYIKEKVFFKKEDIQKYISIFEELKNDGFIIAASFYSNNWTLPCDTSNYFLKLNFDLDVYKELKLAQKIYFLILIRKGKSTSYIKDYQRKLSYLIIETAGLKNVNILEDCLVNDKDKYTTARLILRFIDFYTELDKEAIVLICEKICESERKNKVLPPLTEILIFDEIINDFFNNENNEKFKYRLIQLWWAITNIIPMRPVELLKLKSDCIRKDSRGLFWITITRSKKMKESIHDVPPIQVIQVNKGIYRLFTEFKTELMELNITSEYLFSQKYYQYNNPPYGNRTINFVVDRLKNSQFREILTDFYNEIVMEQYQAGISFRILPSHTRHFAIINLFLQGFNLLSISELAGHDSIHSPNNYYSHSKTFVESYVYRLNRLGLSNNIRKEFSDGFLGWRREKIDEGKMYEGQELENFFLKVDYGYCKDKDAFPNNCCEDCRVCSFYIFKPSINDYVVGLKWLEDYSNELGVDINNVIDSMIVTSKAISSHHRPDLNESLKAKSRQLQQLMDHKMAIEQRLMEDYLHEE